MKKLLLSHALAALLTSKSIDCRADIIIADSLNEFSTVQGQDNWFYGYYTVAGDPSSFTQMTFFDPKGFPTFGPHWERSPTQAPWNVLWGNGGHPDTNWTVRRYISEVSGSVKISGNIGDLEGNFTFDGVVGRIFVGNNEVFNQPISNGDSTGVDYSFMTNVTVGDNVDFAIDPITSIVADSSRFVGVISVPEPSAILCIAFVGATFGCARLLCRSRSPHP